MDVIIVGLILFGSAAINLLLELVPFGLDLSFESLCSGQFLEEAKGTSILR